MNTIILDTMNTMKILGGIYLTGTAIFAGINFAFMIPNDNKVRNFIFGAGAGVFIGIITPFCMIATMIKPDIFDS